MSLQIDGESWMENLPKQKQMCPIQQLIIPGSHDTTSYSISTKQDISPAESKWMKMLVRVFGVLAKKLVYNWSVTQEVDILQQLNQGIRYVDMRIALNPHGGQYQVVHGLYGATLKEILLQVKTFVKAHPKEIVLLDFNHFYGMNTEAHLKFATMITEFLGDNLLPAGSKGVHMTLNDAWDANKNVIVVYDEADVIAAHPSFWPGTDMYSPWANTPSLSTLISFLNKETENQDLPKNSFHVAQGLLTPNTKSIVLHPFSTLKAILALKATQGVTAWIKSVEKGVGHQFNIVIADFIDSSQFIPAVIGINYIEIPSFLDMEESDIVIENTTFKWSN